VIDCPAEEMWADILTKALQGMVFGTMRAQSMNCPINYEEGESEPMKGSTRKPIVAKQLVTWGITEQGLPQTPQKCVGAKETKPTKLRHQQLTWSSKNIGKIGQKYKSGDKDEAVEV
jgi:hypothetical protein